MATLEGEIDYESLPVNSSMATHMIAGAFAGTMEHCVMYPFDFVKVRLIHSQITIFILRNHALWSLIKCSVKFYSYVVLFNVISS